MVFIWLIAGLGGVALAPRIAHLLSTPLLALAGLAAMLIAYYAEVFVEIRPGQRIALTVEGAVSIVCLTIFGLDGAWLVALNTIIFGLSRRRPWERTLFNAAAHAISYSVAALVYAALQPPGGIPFAGPIGLITFFCVAATNYLCDSILVSTMVALATRQPVLQVYRSSLQQASWVHLLIFIIGAGMAALYAIDPWLLIYGVLTLVIARRAFTTIIALNAETRRRQELAEEQARLHAERAKLYQELHEQQVELARTTQLAALGTFAAGIAHEFNNVLTAVLGHAQLGQLSEAGEDKNHALDVIARVSRRATSITASLLTFARKREPELKLERLQVAIDETIALVAPDLELDRVRLLCDIDELPPLLCDIGQLNQVLLNLITNARDALREQGGGTIRLSLKREGELARLTISDDGPGMPPEVRDRIFQPFVTTKVKGNGLGMAICYGIVETHQGKISVESELGRGTTITITLPLNQGPEAPVQPPSDHGELVAAAA